MRSRLFGLLLRLGLGFMVMTNRSAAQRLTSIEGKTVRLRVDDLDGEYRFRVVAGKLRHLSADAVWDVSIAGRAATFVGLILHRLDADELFFTRKLQVEGDIETATYLKNILAQF